MNQYWTLFRTLFRMRFRRNKQSKAITALIWSSVLLVYISLMAIAIGTVYFAAPVFMSFGAVDSLIFMLLASMSCAVVVLGIISMIGYIYFNRDAQFLASLPIKPSIIYFAKLTIVFIDELIMFVVMLLPMLITAGVITGMSAWFYIALLPAMLLAPVLPLLLATLLAIPVMYLVSLFRNKGVVTTVALIALFVGIMALYYIGIARLGGGMEYAEENITLIVQSIIDAIHRLENALYPIKALTHMLTSTPLGSLSPSASVAVNSAIALVSTALLLGIAILVSSKIYYRSVMSQIESTQKKSGTLKYSQSTSVISALIKREWRDLTRNTTFGFQCLAGVVILPVLIFFMYFMGNQTSMINEAGGEDMTVYINMMNGMTLWMLLAMGIGLNVCAVTAVSREGKALSLTKSLPVSYSDILKAKVMLSYLVSVVTLTITAILYAVLYSLPALDLVLMLSFLLVYSYAFTCFCVWRDADSPKLDWTSAYELVKKNMRTQVPMLINMLISIPLAVVLFVFQGMGFAWIGWLSVLVVASVLAILAHRMLRNNGEKALANACP